MASSIEWTHLTWNPTTGCTEHSAWGECDNCYAKTLTKRLKSMGQSKYKAGFDKLVMHDDALKEPYTWKEPSTVFVNSMSDLFHKDVTLEFLKKVFAVMNDTPQHTYQILTKRDKILENLGGKLNWTDNIWMGVSVGAQGATRRVSRLVNSGAKHKFLSVEPFIEEINEIDLTHIDWVIVGGESGGGARPMKKEWVQKMKRFCDEASVPFFFKQWGEDKFNPNPNDPTIHVLHRYHAKGGSQLDGKNYLANPTLKDDSMPSLKLFGEEYFIMDEVGDLKTIWELKSYLPMASDDQIANLREDIRTNGVLDPILYWVTPEGYKLVIEGHTRITALGNRKKTLPQKEIKVEFESLNEIKFWMLKHQLNRRNLSNVEKLQLAFSYKGEIEAKARENQSKAGKGSQVEKPIDTYSEIAKLANVGKATATRYGKIVSKGDEKLIKLLYDEKISIHAASKAVDDAKPPRKTTTPTSSTVIIDYSCLNEAEKALKSGDIDAIIIIQNDNLKANSILKKNSPMSIGIVIQQ